MKTMKYGTGTTGTAKQRRKRLWTSIWSAIEVSYHQTMEELEETNLAQQLSGIWQGNNEGTGWGGVL